MPLDPLEILLTHDTRLDEYQVKVDATSHTFDALVEKLSQEAPSSNTVPSEWNPPCYIHENMYLYVTAHTYTREGAYQVPTTIVRTDDGIQIKLLQPINGRKGKVHVTFHGEFMGKHGGRRDIIESRMLSISRLFGIRTELAHWRAISCHIKTDLVFNRACIERDMGIDADYPVGDVRRYAGLSTHRQVDERGDGMNLGSRSSPYYTRFYNKTRERIEKGGIESKVTPALEQHHPSLAWKVIRGEAVEYRLEHECHRSGLHMLGIETHGQLWEVIENGRLWSTLNRNLMISYFKDEAHVDRLTPTPLWKAIINAAPPAEPLEAIPVEPGASNPYARQIARAIGRWKVDAERRGNQADIVKAEQIGVILGIDTPKPASEVCPDDIVIQRDYDRSISEQVAAWNRFDVALARSEQDKKEHPLPLNWRGKNGIFGTSWPVLLRATQSPSDDPPDDPDLSGGT